MTISNATVSHHGEYSIAITATVDGANASTVFALTIRDPCSVTNFVTSPSPLKDMPVVLASTKTSNQAVKIFTVVEQQHKTIICPISAQLTPSTSFIALSPDFKTISVDEGVLTQLLPGSVQSHAFVLSVSSLNFPNQVTPVQFAFKVVVSCVVEEVRFATNRVADVSYEIDPKSTGPKMIPLPTFTLLPCLTAVKHSRTLSFDAATQQPLPSFISFSDLDGSISVQITDPSDTGTYKLKVVASEPISGLSNSEVRFTLTLTCTVTQLFNSEKNVNNLIYRIPSDLNSKPVSLPLPVYKTTPDYCLLTPYALALVDEAQQSAKLPAFVKLGASSVTILNKDPSVVGSYSFRFVATEARFPQFQDKSVVFSVAFSCDITGLAPVKTEATISELVYVLRSASFSFDMPKYAWQPAACRKDLEFKLENLGGPTFPKFMRFDAQTLKVTLNGDSFEESGKEFRFRLVATTSD